MVKPYIPPTQEEVKLRFAYDPETGVLRHTDYNKHVPELHWREAGTMHPHGYRIVGIRRRLYPVHQIAWLFTYGEMPIGLLDHINRVRHDNRIANLRQATWSQNKHNSSMYSNNKSGEQGVCWNKDNQRWFASIRLNRINKHLGSFINFDDAVAARRRAKAALDAVLFAINPENQEAP